MARIPTRCSTIGTTSSFRPSIRNTNRLVDGSACDRHDSDVHSVDWGVCKRRAPVASEESNSAGVPPRLFYLDGHCRQPAAMGSDSLPRKDPTSFPMAGRNFHDRAVVDGGERSRLVRTVTSTKAFTCTGNDGVSHDGRHVFVLTDGARLNLPVTDDIRSDEQPAKRGAGNYSMASRLGLSICTQRTLVREMYPAPN